MYFTFSHNKKAKNMNLFSHYYEDVEEFARQYGRPINLQDWTEPLVPIALDLGKKLVHGAETATASDGSIIVALDDGNLLALTCLPDRNLGAFATRIGKTYFVAIRFGLIRLIFNLALTLWKDQRFLSHIKHDIRGLKDLATDLIPPGFEEIFLHKFPDKIQHAFFYQCFQQAVSFFWLHEIAHILLGHIDILTNSGKSLGIIDEFLNVAESDEDEPDELIKHTIPYLAFEIQADRWALDRLFEKLHQQIISDSFGDIELICTAIACTLFPLSLHGNNILREKSDHAKHHPPLWFRADEVLYAEDKAANKQWFSVKRGEKNIEIRRSQQKNLVQSALAALSRIHPMFGDWLGPVADSSRQPEGQRVLDEAKVLFEPWRDDLSCHGVKMRDSN
jgi:hypothetical protein